VKGQKKTAHMHRNQDFGNQDEVGEEYSMVLPDSSLYKDFNSETDFVDLKMDNKHSSF
jgi:hypothetical protein